MHRRGRTKIPDETPRHDFESRFMAAVVALLFGAPVLGLLWLGVNFEFGRGDELALGVEFLWGACIALAGFTFAFPDAMPGLIAELWDWLRS